MKKVKKMLSATWEIIETAEFVEQLGRNPNESELRQIYKGEFIPAMQEKRTDRKQIWQIEIVTTAKADDGAIHTHEMAWAFDKPMTMSEVLNGAKHIKVNKDGFVVRWDGVARTWTKTVDEELEGLTAISAWATATCTAQVAPRRYNQVLVDNLAKHIGAVV